MKIGVVIPWREQSSRLKAFNIVMDWYKDNIPEATIYLPDHPGPVWLPSATRNDGVRMAEAEECEVIIMNDADTIPQLNPLRKAVKAAEASGSIHNPYTEYRALTSTGTREVHQGINLDWCDYQEVVGACSGTNVFTPETWWSLGGMDEKFKQWGYEDTAMHVAHKIIKGKSFVKNPGVVFSIGHKNQPREGEDYSNNEHLYREYLDISNPQKMLEFVQLKEYTRTKRRILAG